MSAIRSYIDGIPVWVIVDSGASPRHSGKGGGLIEPQFGAFVTGVSSRKGYEDGRRGKGPKK